ncbi:CRISPR-associated helicase Cas3' [Gemmobacter sp.]|uniref:CRISPR-associated helicase Cas3' n=1 Tax=Gemmobacter sp. TaxID=1898957 RepID=UPI002AFEF33B|nr:CRISPR-associated helicase Cas3' [Gemmobacter sp.]
MDSRAIGDWPGKSAVLPGGAEHPAVYHMLDVAAVAEHLLDGHPRRDLYCLLIALHDLGKIGDGFRAMLRQGTAQIWRHWEVTEAWLQHKPVEDLLLSRLGGGWQALRVLGAAVAGHHGRPPRAQARHLEQMRAAAGAQAAADAQDFVAACLELWPGARLDGLRVAQAQRLSWHLAGVTTVADWIGSNAGWFPAIQAGPSLAAYLDRARGQAGPALQAAGLVAPAAAAGRLFDWDLRPMQAAARDLPLPDGPVLAIIEDETGAGKTEAAMLLLQRMLLAGKGRGAYFALPTMATADAMFGRARTMVRGLFDAPPSLTLAHGRSALSEAFRDLRNAAPSSDAPVCGDWLSDSRRKALLADVGVGTIDQALMAVLPTRFATLRNWGLSRKILIVDEVHELGDPFMAQELATLLRLHAMQGGSAILLSATVPLDLRARLSRAFEEGAGRAFAVDGDPAYPSLSVAGGPAIRDFPARLSPKGVVAVRRLADVAAALDLLAAQAAAGAACVWVRNSVDEAIVAVEALRARGVPADLLHARYALADRKRIEAGVMARFGKAGAGRAGRVLVGTQVLESSLDLDFDVMVSDLAPVAALIQRAGRLWRHMDLRPAPGRPVPGPVLHVVAPDPDQVDDDRWLARVLDGGAWVYGLADQWRTAKVLFDAGEIVAPAGLRRLIEAVHGPDALPVPDALARAELEAEGEGYARRDRARQNVIDIDQGYRDGGGAAEDTDYPTRLGPATRVLMLLRREAGQLVPWAAMPGVSRPEAEMLSEVTASAARLNRLELPDQGAAETVAFMAGWPDWRRGTMTLCEVRDGGVICEGLRYDPDVGLVL